MRIAIVGVGGVGGIIGSALCSNDNHVTFIARGKHKEVIEKNGLHIIEDENSYTVVPNRVCEIDELEGIYDYVLLSVKSYDIDTSMKHLIKHLDDNSIVMPISNGVSHADKIRQLTAAQVLDACVYILAHIERAGVVRKKGKVFAAIFGSVDAPQSVEKVEKLFEKAELRYKTPLNIKEALWKKYIFISCFASLSAYYDKSIYELVSHHEKEVSILLNEIASVARSKDINIDNEIEKSMTVARSLPHDASTSMHKDFTAHRQTELETLSGYIVYEAKAKGLATPLMSKLYKALKEKEQSYTN